jgi:transcription elongation factor SPT5
VWDFRSGIRKNLSPIQGQKGTGSRIRIRNTGCPLIRSGGVLKFLHTLFFRFEETPEGLDIDIGTGDKEEASSHKFSNGDNVEVVEGELQNLQGRVIAVDGTKITILPKHEDLKDPLDFQAKELRKYFRQVSQPSFTYLLIEKYLKMCCF